MPEEERVIIRSYEKIEKRAIDSITVIALASMGITFTILMLAGFKTDGFYLDTVVLIALIMSSSVASITKAVRRDRSG